MPNAQHPYVFTEESSQYFVGQINYLLKKDTMNLVVNWVIPLFRLALLIILNYYCMFTPKSVEFTTLSQQEFFLRKKYSVVI